MAEVPPEPKKDIPDEAPGGPDAPLDASSVIQWCVSILSATAWQAMGLIPHPDTKEIKRNLTDARLAIDSTAALIEVVKSHLSDKQRREVETLLADLRVNFVEQQSKSTSSHEP